MPRSKARGSRADGVARAGGHVGVWLVLKTVFSLGAAFLVLVTVTDGGTKGNVRWGALALLALVIAALYFTHRICHRLLHPTRSPGVPTIPSITKSDREELIIAAASEYKAQELERFCDLLIYPSRYIYRVIEDVEIQHQRLRLKSAFDLDISETSEERILIPLMWVKKGDLIDNVEVQDGERKPLCILPQNQTKSLVSLVVAKLFMQAFIAGRDPQLGEWQAFAHARKEFDEIIDHIWRVNKADGPVDAILKRLRVRISPPWAAPPWKIDENAFSSLRDLCKGLADYYLLSVEVKGGRRSNITFKNDIPLRNSIRQVGYGKWVDLVRFHLGGKPYRFAVPTAWPFRTPSYHFRMSSEAGQYVASEYFAELATGNHLNMSELPEPKPYLQVREPAGRPHSHLYAHGLDQAEPFGMAAVVEFDETPPGVLGAAVAISGAVAALIAIYTLWLQPRGLLPRGTTGANIPAFFLAFLVFGITWLGFASDKESLLKTSLLARLSLLTAAFFSLVAGLFYIADFNWLHQLHQYSLFGGTWHLPINNCWLGLSIAATVVFGFTAAAFWIHSSLYMREANEYWSD